MKARIQLIAEDRESLELMRLLLRERGLEALCAPDGRDPAAFAAAQSPDLILCEPQITAANGDPLLRAIRARPVLAGVPVVALAALADAGEGRRLRAAGFDGHLARPIDPLTFAEDIARLLPHRPRPAGSAPPVARAQTARSILVVDDLRANLELAEIVLQRLGYEVTLAQGKREALRALRTARPDLILSDVCMDGGDGFDLLREVDGDPALHAIPFILITSGPDSREARVRGMDLGADRCLFRPIAPTELRRQIEACVRERRGA